MTGAGPGDPELLTLRAKHVIESADVILYDALVSPRVLDWAPENCEKIFVGKAHGSLVAADSFAKKQRLKPLLQTEINQLMLKFARAGKTIVRLKGGDPLMFGRGGEEAEFLAKHGIAVEIIPGITAAFGAFASLAIPVTHREYASQVALITGHEDPSKKVSGLNYDNLAAFEGTLVFYMGVGRLDQIVKELIARGRDPKTPVLIARMATTPEEEILTGTLKDIAGKVRKKKLQPPCLIMIGKAARHHIEQKLRESRPLFGKKVLISRAAAQGSKLKDRLERLGAETVHVPATKFSDPDWKPVDRAIRDLENRKYDWVVFTSQNGADFFDKRLRAKSKDWRVLAGTKIAAIGEATAKRLREQGVRSDLIPKKFVAEELFAELARRNAVKGKRFLLLRGDLARPYLRKELKKAGAGVTEAVVYRTVPEKSGRGRLKNILGDGAVDFVPFTSSSSVESFISLSGKSAFSRMNGKTKIISIGPVTTGTLKKHGIKVHRQAKRFDIEGIVEAILKGEST